MGMLLKNARNIDQLMDAIRSCKGDVWLRRCDGSEEFNMKSLLSMYVAIGKLASDHGDEYEFFCNKEDQPKLLKFFDILWHE